MKNKIETLFDYIKTLCESDLDRSISFVLDIVCVSQQPTERPNCPHCGGTAIMRCFRLLSAALAISRMHYLHHYAQLVLRAIGTVCEISKITFLLQFEALSIQLLTNTN